MPIATDDNKPELPQRNVIPIRENLSSRINDHAKNERKEVTRLVDAIVAPKLQYLCKKYCCENRFQYRCTIDPKWGKNEKDVQYCEWGNATYLWMLEDLTSESKLESFKKNNGTFFDKYIRTVINSIPFFERYKDWRFKKKVRVPDYIKVIDKSASRIFWGLCDEEQVANIAQRLNKSENEVRQIADEIKLELAKRKRTYVLNSAKYINKFSYEEDGSEYQNYHAERSETPEKIFEHQQVLTAYKQLQWQDQFVIECLVIDNINVKSLIKTLIDEDIMLIDGVPATHIKEQQIYYMLRKALARLAEKINL